MPTIRGKEIKNQSASKFRSALIFYFFSRSSRIGRISTEEPGNYFAGAGAAAGAAAGALSAAGMLTGAGAAELGAGAAFWMLETFTGVLTAKEAQMLTTQMKIAEVLVAAGIVGGETAAFGFLDENSTDEKQGCYYDKNAKKDVHILCFCEKSLWVCKVNTFFRIIQTF